MADDYKKVEEVFKTNTADDLIKPHAIASRVNNILTGISSRKEDRRIELSDNNSVPTKFTPEQERFLMLTDHVPWVKKLHISLRLVV